MTDRLVGKLVVFHDDGNGDECASGNILIQVADFKRSGEVELAFSLTRPISSKSILYVSFNLPSLLRIAMQNNGTKEERP